MQDLIERLARELPPIFERTQVDRLTGGVVRHRTLANMQSKGEGVPGAYKVGKKVVIPRDEFLAWLSDRMEPYKRDQLK